MDLRELNDWADKLDIKKITVYIKDPKTKEEHTQIGLDEKHHFRAQQYLGMIQDRILLINGPKGLQEKLTKYMDNVREYVGELERIGIFYKREEKKKEEPVHDAGPETSEPAKEEKSPIIPD